jgi:hypothetical protein
MTKDSAKLAHALVTKYTNLFELKYGRKPTMNRYREKWAMQDVIDSVGYDRAVEILDYYFQISKSGHPLAWFYNNFDKIDESMLKLQEDKNRRAKLLEQTKRMVEENEQ